MDDFKKRKRSGSEEVLPLSHHKKDRTVLQPDYEQPTAMLVPHADVRPSASYANSSTHMNGSSQAHFGDNYHIFHAAPTSKVDVNGTGSPIEETRNFSLTNVIASMWQRRSKAKALDNRLGEWASDARCWSGEYLIPVLSRAAFEEHLVKHDARFRPAGPPTSSFAWAQLLFVFDIHPGQGIVLWRHAQPEEDPLVTGTMSLDVDGQSLCHLINLYWEPRLERTAGGFSKAIPMASNSLVIKTAAGTLYVKKDLTSETNACRWEGRPGATPYGISCSGRMGNIPPDGNLMESYLEALHHGTSHPDWRLPDPNAPLQDRARALARLAALDYRSQRFFTSIEQKKMRDDVRQRFSKPVVTSSWLESASRIKRRVTTNGGNDPLLRDIMTRFLINNEAVREVFDRRATSHITFEVCIQTIVQRFFMFDNEKFEVVYRDAKSNPPIGLMEIIEPHILAAIKGLGAVNPNMWTADLAKMAEEVVDILYLWSEINHIDVLALGTDHWLWEANCRIPG